MTCIKQQTQECASLKRIEVGVDVETAQMEWSKRNMGTRWAASFRELGTPYRGHLDYRGNII